jgi:hypothetical protein
MQLIASLIIGDFNAILGSGLMLGVIGVFMFFKVRGIYRTAQHIIEKLNPENRDKELTNMVADLKTIDMAFSLKYGKNLKIVVEDN